MSCDALLRPERHCDGRSNMGWCKDLGRYSSLNSQQVPMRKAASLCRRSMTDKMWMLCSQQGSAGGAESSAGGQFPNRAYSRPRQMQVPEPARLVSPSVRKRQFIEQKRAEEEARRRQQSQNASAESTKVTIQGRAARRQDDSNAARRASNAAASTSGGSHNSSSSSRVAPASASRPAPKQAQAASTLRAGIAPGHGKPRLSGVVALNGSTNAQAGQAADRQHASLHPDEEACVAQALEYKAFGGTATSKTEPKSGYMERYGQRVMLHQRVEDERRRSTGVPQHVEFADDIMPDFPADLQRAAMAAHKVRQLQTVGASQTSASTREMAVSSAGSHARQSAYGADKSVRSQGGYGGSGFSSQGSWPQDRSVRQAEYSSSSSSMLEPAQELYSSMEDLFEEEEQDSKFPTDTAFVQRHRHAAMQNGDGGDDDSPSGDGQTDLEEFSSSNEDNIVTTAPREVYIVDSVPKAQAVLGRLQAIHAANPDTIFACDTEVSDIDISKESPCGHGTVICFSVYCGQEVHFGELVDGQPADGILQNQLWVDTLVDEPKGQATVDDIWEVFRAFLEDPSMKKAWHNYSFDRHVLGNVRAGGRPIRAAGFHADTMHMARLWDASRKGKGYSLEALSGDQKLFPSKLSGPTSAKTGMKELFAQPKLKKDGTQSKIKELPPMEVLQQCQYRRGKWIKYSALDAKATYDLAMALKDRLEHMECAPNGALGMDPDIAGAIGLSSETHYTMWDLYLDYWQPFGKLLTDMEAQGFNVDRQHLHAAEGKAMEDQENAKKRFRDWVKTKVPDAEYMNICSGPQIQQLLFSGVPVGKGEKQMPMERTFKVPNVVGYIEEGKKVAKKQMDIILHGLWGPDTPSPLQVDIYTASGAPAVSTPVLRSLAGKPGAAKKALLELEGEDTSDSPADDFDEVPLEALADDENLAALEAGQEGEVVLDSADLDSSDVKPKKKGKAKAQAPPTQASIKASAEDAGAFSSMQPLEQEALVKEAASKGYGKLYAVFGGGLEGLRACAAVDALCEVGAVDTLLSNFIRPLQGEAIATVKRDPLTSNPILDPQGKPVLARVHCSLNLNTETGRLSARRPNLQNQPALEKDRYKVRKAFKAEEGNTLVVADYGQLELRLLAHMAGCASMLEAFRLGGDFHSRTALGMYDHIKAAIDRGDCLLEWDSVDGQKAPVPLLKDMFGSERRKAKVLNFSIAYGKTAHGLSRDWGTSQQEAQATVDRWYSDRPEVEEWQKIQRRAAREDGYVCTILGRRRLLPDAKGGKKAAQGHALRAAINTPIQGSAADVATAAMLSIDACQELKELGWKMLLQVHDEVIMEGPKESAERAQQLVVQHMENPFNGQNPLKVALVVDSNTADTWYEAK